MLVINKPAGMVVNRSDTTANAFTVQDFAEVHVVKSESDAEFTSRGGIVHRLDKDTSGVMVIAKTGESFHKLKEEFKERRTIKKYLTLVHGKVEPASGTVDAPIERSPFNRMHFGIFPGGRDAVSHYKTVKVLTLRGENMGQNALTLLEVEPKTGRTHQIRVHMKYLGHTVVSDPIYGGRKQLKDDLMWCPRLFLHAQALGILGETFSAPLPSDLQGVLDLLS